MFKRIFLSLICAISMVAPLSVSAETRSAKLLNLFLDPGLTANDVKSLARWDIVVLDLDQQWRHPDLLAQLKKLNPSIKILAYVSASEISQARFNEDYRAPGYKLTQGIDPSWFIVNADGSKAMFWPKTWLLNPTNGAKPNRAGQRWNTYLPNFIKTKVLSTGLWDGVFLDATYGYVTGNYGTNLDLNRDGKADNFKDVDQRFFEGMTVLLQNLRAAIGSDKLILTNSGERYAWLTNGTLFENVPQYGWTLPFNLSQEMQRQNQSPIITAINTNAKNQNRPDDYQSMRLGVSTALIAGDYFSFDFGDTSHHQTWWYDEYTVDLGAPTSDPLLLQTVSSTQADRTVWGRSFTNGYVIANPTDQTVTVTLSEKYQRLNGVQDPIYNNSKISETITVPAKDGIVLKKLK